jgi:hypothetical protein
MNAMLLLASAVFLIGLQPARGVGGGPVRVTIEAHDANTAKRLATAKYGPMYKVYDVRRINERQKRD